MKIRSIAAAAALAFVASANALTPAQIDAARADQSLKEVFVAGASALRLSLGAYLQEVCTPASFDVFYNNAAGANFRAYSCNLAVAQGNWAVGTPVLVVKRDSGGSVNGVGPVAGVPPPGGVFGPTTVTPIAKMVVSAAGCAATANASPATDILLPTFLCGTTVNEVPHIGISDVEPARFRETVNLAAGVTPPLVNNLNTASLAQGLFAVAVNPKLYTALQLAQGIAPSTPPVNQDLWDATVQASIPSLPSSFIRAALSGGLSGGSDSTSQRGWNVVTGVAGDALKTINICRRTEGSGTQAASNLFFLQNALSSGGGVAPSGCLNTVTANVPASCNSSPNAAQLPLVSGSNAAGTGTIVFENAGSGDVETCFANTEAAAGGDAYALGVISRENNPLAVAAPKQYRFVKIDGAVPLRSAAQLGNYPFVYEATMQWNPTYLATVATAPGVTAGPEIQAFGVTLRSASGMGKAVSIAGADIDTRQGIMASPSTYTGPYLGLAAGVVRDFSSRVSRGNANSFLPLRIVK